MLKMSISLPPRAILIYISTMKRIQLAVPKTCFSDMNISLNSHAYRGKCWPTSTISCSSSAHDVVILLIFGMKVPCREEILSVCRRDDDGVVVTAVGRARHDSAACISAWIGSPGLPFSVNGP